MTNVGRVVLAITLGATAVACGVNRVVYGIDASGSGGEASSGAAGGAGAGGAATAAGGSGGGVDAGDARDVGKPADAGALTDAQDAGALTDAGDAGNVTYLGCRFIGGINRVVVAKLDTARGLCLNVVLFSLASRAGGTEGLTLPPTYTRGVSGVVVPASACPSAARPSPRGSLGDVPASTVTGTVTATATAPDAGIIDYVDIDVTLTLPANDAGAAATERLRALNVDVRSECTQ